MHDDVGAMLDWPAEIRRCESVVDDQRYARALRDFRNRFDVRDYSARIGDRLDEYGLGFGANRAFETSDIVGLGPYHVPTEVLECVIELIDRSPIDLLRRHELIVRSHQTMHDDHPGRHAPAHHWRAGGGGARAATR